MRRFAIGDIHGRHEALVEVLKLSNFNYLKDQLIILGDVADGGYNTYQVVEELLKIDNTSYIIGNHDEWFMNHIKSGWAEEIWLQQGGANTLESYGAKVKIARNITSESLLDTSDLTIPVTHQAFFNQGKYYDILEKKLFVHGGIDPKLPIDKQKKETLLWDRMLIEIAKDNPIDGYDKIFVGHTTTERFGAEPLLHNNLWQLDCGAGWSGRLCIMDIDTEEYWLSDWQKSAGR